MKGFKKFFIGTLALLLLFTNIAKADTKFPEPTNLKYVNDYTSTLNDNTKEFLISLGKELEDKTTAQATVVVIDSLQGMDIRDYGNKLFRAWGIGQKNKNNGLLILVAKNDRKYSVEVGKGLEGAITDIGSSRIMDEYAKPKFKEENFDEGLKDVYSLFCELIAKEYNVTLEKNINISLDKINKAQNYSKSSSKDTSNAIMPIIIFIIIVIISSLGGGNRRNNRRRRRRRYYKNYDTFMGPFIPFNPDSSNNSSNDSGGFGGFGGFGGGDSGGGGSSGGW